VEAIKSMTDLAKSAAELIKSVTDLTLSVMETIFSVADSIRSVMETIDSVMDLSVSMADLVKSATHLSPWAPHSEAPFRESDKETTEPTRSSLKVACAAPGVSAGRPAAG
jgi:hypothetical protein